MPAFSPLSSYAVGSYASVVPATTAHASSGFVSPIAGARLTGVESVASGAALATDLAGARALRAVAQPRPRQTCNTLLPQTSPVDVQVERRTVMHLRSEPDRVAFLNENRVSALWMETLDATRAPGGCPAEVRPGQVASDIAQRMSCLGIGVGELRRSDRQASPRTAANVANTPVETSEFATIEALSLPSVYIREPGFEPGTMAALEYDLGWRALAPSWRDVMPAIDEEVWASNPNTALFCAVGRAVLPHLATFERGELMDPICARIVSFHMHAGGLQDCLSNVTQTVERLPPDGDVTSVAAIELSDFLRECAGADWRDALIGDAPGNDALTRRREVCLSASATASTGTTAATEATAATVESAVTRTTGTIGTTGDAPADANEWLDATSAEAVRRARSTSL
ncbi:hypothetical protein PCA31118_02811 [Pandoraea captiosa]|uniref:Uncharacterized protein n=1 Tax=Pandoraea captiosa TaxID=2508302 RepID=A0A5E5A3M9_9BURK|nr:hypothetical protein [Pandoraea captiosa]VVE68204.1 hypothetical protein PCA31118_02811 [Pandoraea captiosa]